MSSPGIRRRIGRGGHDLQQWLKGRLLPQTRFPTTVQKGPGICNENDAELNLLDIQCSVGL